MKAKLEKAEKERLEFKQTIDRLEMKVLFMQAFKSRF